MKAGFSTALIKADRALLTQNKPSTVFEEHTQNIAFILTFIVSTYFPILSLHLVGTVGCFYKSFYSFLFLSISALLTPFEINSACLKNIVRIDIFSPMVAFSLINTLSFLFFTQFLFNFFFLVLGARLTSPFFFFFFFFLIFFFFFFFFFGLFFFLFFTQFLFNFFFLVLGARLTSTFLVLCFFSSIFNFFFFLDLG